MKNLFTTALLFAATSSSALAQDSAPQPLAAYGYGGVWGKDFAPVIITPANDTLVVLEGDVALEEKDMTGVFIRDDAKSKEAVCVQFGDNSYVWNCAQAPTNIQPVPAVFRPYTRKQHGGVNWK
jgi:hypothetical protein